MSKRVVHAVERITYTFSIDEVIDVLLSHGEDCRGNHLLPGAKVEWGEDGVSLVYEYKSEKKESPLLQQPAPVFTQVSPKPSE